MEGTLNHNQQPWEVIAVGGQGSRVSKFSNSVQPTEKMFYTKAKAAAELGVSRSVLNKVISKRKLRGRYLVGSAHTIVFSVEAVEEMRQDELVTRVVRCRFCGEDIIYPRGGKVFNVCRKKECRTQYHACRYRERYTRPFNPDKLRGLPKLIWEKLSSFPDLIDVEWGNCSSFRKISRLSNSQMMHLADLGVIKTKTESGRTHPVTGKPIRLYALYQAILIAEVVNSEGP